MGQRDAELARVHPPGRLWAEPRGQGQAALNPAWLLPAQRGDGPRPQSVLVPERPDHAGLVHRRERPHGAVRPQERRLLLRQRRE